MSFLIKIFKRLFCYLPGKIGYSRCPKCNHETKSNCVIRSLVSCGVGEYRSEYYRHYFCPQCTATWDIKK